MQREHIVLHPRTVTRLESTPSLGGHQFGLEPVDLGVENGQFRGTIEDGAASLLVNAQDALEHAQLVGRQTVVPAPVIAGRPVVANEAEAGNGSPDPEVVVLVAAERLVEAANRLV